MTAVPFRRTLRFRLLAGITVTTVSVLCVTQLLLYLLIRRQMVAEFDASLAARARSLAVLTEQTGDVIDMKFREHPMQEFARSIRPEYYQVTHESGDILARSRQLRNAELPELNGCLVLPMIRSVMLPDGRRGRAAGIRFCPRVDGETLDVPVGELDRGDDQADLDTVDFSERAFVTLVVARGTEDLDSSLARIRSLLIGSGLLAAVLIPGVLSWLTWRHMKPLKSLAEQIDSVGAAGLHRRFELPDAPGELEPVVLRLNELMGELEEAFRREKEFSSDAAHELRTPLAGMRATLEFSLIRPRSQEAYRRSIRTCLRIVQDTESVISTLLALARIDSGREAVEPGMVDVTALIERLLCRFSERIRERRLNVREDVPAGLTVVTDGTKLGVVLSNLLDNATCYADVGGHVTVCAKMNDDRLVITAANSGCTLSERQMVRVFDRFWRADTSRSATGSNSGLGLALSQRIIQLLGGTITAICDEGNFVVTIVIPAEWVDADENECGLEGHVSERTDAGRENGAASAGERSAEPAVGACG